MWAISYLMTIMKRIVFFLWLVCVLVSCGSIETVSYEQLTPAAYSFPKNIKDVAVVNHMPPTGEAKSGVMTFGDMEGDGKISADALAESLANSRYFNQVVVCDSALSANGEGELLPQNTVAELSNGLNVDMLISVDRVFIQKAKLEVLYPGMNVAWPIVRVKVTPVINLYIPSREKPIRVIAQDSLDWNVDEVISDKDMQKEAASFAAHLICRKLVPYWTSAERLYYAGGSAEMRDGSVWVRENHWDKAYSVWFSLYDTSKSAKTKMKAAFNLALASEMMGRIEDAEQWLDRAQKHVKAGSHNEQICKYYAAQLQARKDDYARLDAQMNRF